MTALAISVAPLSGAELARARQYLYGDLFVGALSQLWMLALLAAAYFSGASGHVAAWLRRRAAGPGWVVAGVVVALFAGVLTALLPFSYYLDFMREREFGFLHLGFGPWLLQWAESSLLAIAAGLVVAGIGYAWLRRAAGRRRWWWLRLWAVVAVAVVFAVAIEPVVVEPLFNRFTPVENPVMRAEIAGLARRAGIPRARIYEMDASRDSAHTNAYVTGILGSQRIVVYDTLLRAETPQEVEFVVGHEIGHYVLHHLWKGVAFTLAYLLGLFAFLGWLFPPCAGDVRRSRAGARARQCRRGHRPEDPAALPLLLLVLLGVLYLTAPVTNGFSRWEEHQADAYGLRLTRYPCAAVASFQAEERTDLIYPDPPEWIVWWFFNHPSQQQRIAFARGFCRQSR